MTDIPDIEDDEALQAYLRGRGLLGVDDRAETVRLTGGVSNRTVLVRCDGKSRWVLKQALEKLRVEADWYCEPQRIEVEARGLQWLERLIFKGAVPAFVFEDREAHILGMEAISEPHHNWKSCLLRGDVEDRHVQQFAFYLSTIHGASQQHAAELSHEFAERRYFESLRLEPYYLYTAAQVPLAESFLRELVDATRRQRLALVHGDYSPKNVLVWNDQLVLLDHEVMHWGDPAFDVGFALTHFLSKAHYLIEHRDRFLQVASNFWHAYHSAVAGIPTFGSLEPLSVRHTLGCLLARVAGRSPLEYLDAARRSRQQEVVVKLIARQPQTIDGLIAAFAREI